MTSRRTILLTAALLAAVSACGSGDDSTNTPAATDADGTEEANPSSDEETPDVGAGTGTLTLDDGTVYSLTMSTCETSENGADGFLLENSYDLLGSTADGAFVVTIGRAGLDEDFVTQLATLEGEFDENGQNAQLIYRNVLDTIALEVDGGDVSGTVTLRPLGPNRPHGDEIGAVVDVSC